MFAAAGNHYTNILFVPARKTHVAYYLDVEVIVFRSRGSGQIAYGLDGLDRQNWLIRKRIEILEELYRLSHFSDQTRAVSRHRNRHFVFSRLFYGYIHFADRVDLSL